MAEQVIIEFIGDTSGLQPAVDTLESIGGIDKNLADSFRKNNAAIQDRIKLLNETAKSADTVGQAADDLSKDFKKVSDSIKIEGGKKVIEDLGKNINQATDKSQRLTTQLRAMKQELAALEIAGKAGSKAFTDLAVKAGKLEDQIGDTAKRVRALASDTKNIDGVVGVVSGLAGAFSAAQGAAALLGGENEDLQKGLLKVQAAMALATGVQQVANTLQKESAASVAIASAAQSAYAFVVGTSTGALKAFRIALAATGIGLFVIAIGAVVTNFEKIKAKVIELFPILTRFGDIFTAIKAVFFGSVAAFVEGITGIGKAFSALFLGKLSEAKEAITSIDLKGAFDAEVKATYKAAADAAAKGNDELVEAVVYGGEKVVQARKEVAKREIDEINKLPINNPKLASEQAVLVEKAKTDAAFQGAEERIAIANYEENQKSNIRQLSAISEQALNDFIIALSNNRISQLEKQAEAGIISEEKAAREIARIKRNQAIAGKADAIFNIAINTPVAVSKVLAQLGIAGIPANVVIGAIMALQLGTVLAQPIPKFAKGTENVSGGTPGKDSVLAMLMPGERVVPAHINKRLGGITNAELPNLIPAMPYISDSSMSSMERGMLGHGAAGIDYDKLAEKLAARMERAFKKMPQSKINVDKNGLVAMVAEGNATTRYWDDKFSWNG